MQTLSIWESLARKIIFQLGEGMEIRRSSVWRVGRIRKQFPAKTINQMLNKFMFMGTSIVLNQKHTIWQLLGRSWRRFLEIERVFFSSYDAIDPHTGRKYTVNGYLSILIQ